MTDPRPTEADLRHRARPIRELAEDLIEASVADTTTRRAAMHLLVGYGDYSLLRLVFVRDYVVDGGDNLPYVQWSRFATDLTRFEAFEAQNYDLIDTADPAIARITNLRKLAASSRDALRIAVSLGSGAYNVNLSTTLTRFGAANRRIVAEALAIACGMSGTIVVPVP